jgi:hypothetical protein
LGNILVSSRHVWFYEHGMRPGMPKAVFEAARGGHAGSGKGEFVEVVVER